MTVSSETAKVDYTGDGTTTTFPVPFYFLADEHLKVLTLSANVETILVLNTDYTVSGAGNPSGGSITATTAPAAGVQLTIVRNVPFTQETDYQPNDPFPAASHEEALDKLTMEAQQLNEELSRSLTLPISATASTELPMPEASSVIAWNQDGDALENVALSDIVNTAVAGFARADIFTGNGVTTTFTLTANPGSQANLDVSISGVTQKPGIDYTWTSGTTITFTTAPPLGTNTILVRYTVALPAASTETADNLSGGDVGYVPYQDGVGSTTFIAPGTEGQVFTTHGAGAAPTWETPSGPGSTYTAGNGLDLVGTEFKIGSAKKTKAGTALTGVSTRPITDMIGDMVSIKDYGAIGDGAHATEDTAAFAAAAASGTTVYLPPGSYIINSTITFATPGTSFIGAGVDATYVQSTFASGDVFNITGGWIKIEGISFSTSVVRTSGSTINMAGSGPSRSLKNFGISGAYIGVSMNGTLDEISSGSIRDTVSGSGMAIQVGDSASGYNQLIENVITDAPFTTLSSTINSSATTIPLTDASGFASSGVVTIEWEQIAYSGKSGNSLTGATRGYNSTTAASHNSGKAAFAAPLAGLRLFRTYDIRVVGCEFQHNIHGCYISPGNSQLAYAGYFDSCYFDSSSWAALTMLPTGTGIANLCRFDACWFGNTATGDGVFIGAANIQGTHFNQCQVISNTRYGYYVAAADDTSIIGGRVEGSGDHGINFYAGTNRFNIVGVTAASNANWGISIGSSCDYFNVTNCVIYNNTNGSLQDSSGAEHNNVTLNVCDGPYNTRGIGHNANDVTASRSLSLNAGSAFYYSNNRPYPMFVSVQLSFSGAGGFISQAIIGNSYPSGTRVGTVGTNYGGDSLLSHSFIVPPNSSYYVTKNVSGVSVAYWVEYF